GGSRRHKTTEILCLNTEDGKVVWRVPSDLPVWGSPAGDENVVFYGLGNGRLQEPPPPPARPAGALLCLDARSGIELWRWRACDAVFCKPALEQDHVYFGSRDGFGYCLDRHKGQFCWKVDLES